jgi:hypothetical protein
LNWFSPLFGELRNPVHQLFLFPSNIPLPNALFSWHNVYPATGRPIPLGLLPLGLLPITTTPVSESEEAGDLCSPLIPFDRDKMSGSAGRVRLFFPFGKTAMTIKAGSGHLFDAGSNYTILPVHMPTRVWIPAVSYYDYESRRMKYGTVVIESDDGKRLRAYVKLEADESQYGIGCAAVNIPVTVSPPRVPASQETVVQVTIPAGYQFFYGVIQGGREPVIFERPGTYRVIIPPGVNRRPIRVTFHSSQPNCPVSVTEVLVDREPLAVRGWIIAADPGFPDAPPKGGPYGPGVYWEGPSYESGIPRLKEISVAYQKKHGMQLPEIPPAPSRKGIALLTENPSTGTRQREW